MKILNYRIEIGENVESICEKFKMPVYEFIKLNKFKNFNVGNVVLVKIKQKKVVQPNDNLKSIAESLFIEEDELIKNFGAHFFIGEKLEL